MQVNTQHSVQHIVDTDKEQFFIHSFHKYLLSLYHVPSTIIYPRIQQLRKQTKLLPFDLIFQGVLHLLQLSPPCTLTALRRSGLWPCSTLQLFKCHSRADTGGELEIRCQQLPASYWRQSRDASLRKKERSRVLKRETIGQNRVTFAKPHHQTKV